MLDDKDEAMLNGISAYRLLSGHFENGGEYSVEAVASLIEDIPEKEIGAIVGLGNVITYLLVIFEHADGMSPDDRLRDLAFRVLGRES